METVLGLLGAGGDSGLQCALVQVKPQATQTCSLFAGPGEWECWSKAPGEVEPAKVPWGMNSPCWASVGNGEP